jgi:hypothetical protein
VTVALGASARGAAEGPPSNTDRPEVVSTVLKRGSNAAATFGEWSGTTPITFTFQWQRCDGVGANCADIPGATGELYTFTSDDVGMTLSVEVVATNALGSATATSMKPTPPIEASGAPTLTLPPAISGSVAQGAKLTVSTGTWTGITPISFGYGWLRCEPDGDLCRRISGAREDSYVLTRRDVDHALRAVVTARDRNGLSTALTKLTGLVAKATLPVNTKPPTVSGRAKVGSRLTARAGYWIGAAPIRFSYQWQRCNTDGSDCENIDGATGKTYNLASADAGHTIRVAVTATNSTGSSTATSTPTSVVPAAAVAPKNTGEPTISGTPLQGETLSSSTGSWTGTQPISFAYQWVRCGTDGGAPDGSNCAFIPGATGSTYLLQAADVGRRLRVRVTGTNGAGSQTVASNPTATVAPVAVAPKLTTPPTISGSTKVGQQLTANPGTWTGTQPISFSYQWQRCNTGGGDCQSVDGATGKTYNLASADAGHTIRVAVTATNAAGTTGTLTAATSVVSAIHPLARPPRATSAPTVVGTARYGETLTANPGVWTGTQPISFSYRWLRCNTGGGDCDRIDGAQGRTYQVAITDINHTLRVLVTASNQAGRRTAFSGSTPVVAPSIPVSKAPPVITGTAGQGEALKASPGQWESATPIALSYQWARCDAQGANCIPIADAKAETYTPTEADVGHRLIVQVKAENSSGPRWVNSQATAVVAARPAPPPPPAPPPSRSVPISQVSLPDRLLVDRVQWNPRRVRSRAVPLVLRVHVVEANGGRSVSGALVKAIGVPFNRLSAARESVTRGDGWATIVFRVRPTFELRRGNFVVVFLRARKPGEPVLGGVSTRRLVSVRVGS